ncbi:MAG: YpsA SLOG family protein [Thermodesulfobacteriota bacterium]
MMIKKIVSGGQTGADRAALDIAMKFAIPHGGWVPKGRKTENGSLPDKYQLKELSTASYTKRTEQNVLDSDATLLISHGKLAGGSAYTRRKAVQHSRPWLHIDLTKTRGFEAARTINLWIARHTIEILNVAGPRASEDPEIYQATVDLLQTVFYLDLIQTTMPGISYDSPSLNELARDGSLPKTVDQAVEELVSGLSLKDKASIAKMNEEELTSLQPTLGAYIRNTFRLWPVNRALKEFCFSVSGEEKLDEEEAAAVIIRALWEHLRETYRIRVIK